jgi:peptidoglycan/LPS O-acetylase OafA/YrhL
VRFFAAFYVVVFHTRLSAQLAARGLTPAAHFFASGYLAVPLFFILSGFILAYTYKGQIESGDRRMRFWEARFARIWPAYAFSLVCSSVPGFQIPSWGLAAATLAMVQAWNPLHPGYAGAWNLVCWTLSVEAFFYLCFPWLQVFIERRSVRVLQVSACALLLFSVICNIGARTLSDPVYPGIFRFIPLPVIHLPEFLIGMVLGNLLLLRAAPRTSFPFYTCSGLVGTIAALCLPAGHWTSLVLIFFALLVFGLATERTWVSRFLSTKLLLLGGGISYSVYLLQTPIRTWMHALFNAAHFDRPAIEGTLVPLALTLFSLLVFLYIENPARLLLRDLFARAQDARTRRAAMASK